MIALTSHHSLVLLEGTLLVMQGIALARTAARQLAAHDSRGRLRTAGKMMLFAACHPRACLYWLSYLEHPVLRPLVQAQPLLLDKPRRLYLNSLWTPVERVHALVTHYEWMTAHLDTQVVESLYAGQALRLCDLALRDNAYAASIWLDHARLQMREGELALLLCAGATDATSPGEMPPVLATLSFSVIDEGGQSCLSIGCVQGPRNAGLPHFKALTKAMHGLRPKALLVWAAQRCALQWQLGVRGIAPDAHPLTDWRYHKLNAGKRAVAAHIHAGYGTLWRESGGAAPDRQGWVQLPAAPIVKSREDVEAAKRALYERRGALLSDLDTQLMLALKRIARDARPCTA
ncbi:DUF535 family protein [Variovorax ginsengisoli]|uniref:Uncharacterized protein VirK/YbjX n=1 Tax=Variovorax ginsengisoli TaxID=363844 RepID=A0ABT9S7C9_9BURK|nr:DUF535 family protein [Variovorax ginsengisoli]MDP9899671.1 uncharacterized protein VirK/YbjX [Variovorax ginsengisoli]